MFRLTADLVLASPQYFNAVREREIDLRGNKIAVIENLGATEDQFDSIDLSDNEIVKVEGFPLLKRLNTLLLNNNRVSKISPAVGAHLPNLKTLVLTNNRIANLSDLDPLTALPRLECLSLLDNLVTKKPNYRLYLIHNLPRLKVLDFRKIKPKEREQAKQRFAAEREKEDEERAKGNTFEPGEALKAVNGVGGKESGGDAELVEEGGEQREEEKKGPTPEQLTAIKAAIATAQTLEEVSRLEKALKSGVLPPEIASIAPSTVTSVPSNMTSVSKEGEANNVDNSEAKEVEDKDTQMVEAS